MWNSLKRIEKENMSLYKSDGSSLAASYMEARLENAQKLNLPESFDKEEERAARGMLQQQRLEAPAEHPVEKIAEESVPVDAIPVDAISVDAVHVEAEVKQIEDKKPNDSWATKGRPVNKK